MSELQQTRTRQRIFSAIYFNNHWGDPESASGPGSGLARTAAFRTELARLLKELRAGSLLDAPCGDFNWMQAVELDVDRYIGVDIVPELIAQNQARFGNDRRNFLCLDLTQDRLPRADVILCRDGLVHLSCAEIRAALRNCQESLSSYLLATTFIRFAENADIPTGAWRQLNLQRPPFNFPPPLKLIDEHCTHSGGVFADKHLALWELKTLPI